MKRTLVLLADPTLGLTGPAPAGDDFQAQLVEAGLKDTLAVCHEVHPGSGSPPPGLVLAYPDRRDWYAQVAPQYWLLVPQMGANLAQRLDNILLFLSPTPEDETLILGPRTPHVAARDLQHAFIALGQRGACLGPTLSGGVYALGIRGRWPTGVLQQVRWQAAAAASDLRRLFRKLRLGIAMLDKLEALSDPAQVARVVDERLAIDRPALPFMKQLARRLGPNG